jgi:hypothetical protein
MIAMGRNSNPYYSQKHTFSRRYFALKEQCFFWVSILYFFTQKVLFDTYKGFLRKNGPKNKNA